MIAAYHLSNEVMEKQYKVYVITYRRKVPAGVYVFCYRTIFKDLYLDKLEKITNNDDYDLFSVGNALSDYPVNSPELLSFSKTD